MAIQRHSSPHSSVPKDLIDYLEKIGNLKYLNYNLHSEDWHTNFALAKPYTPKKSQIIIDRIASLYTGCLINKKDTKKLALLISKGEISSIELKYRGSCLQLIGISDQPDNPELLKVYNEELKHYNYIKKTFLEPYKLFIARKENIAKLVKKASSLEEISSTLDLARGLLEE